MSTLTDHAAKRLAARNPLPLDPASTIAVKRDVHEFVVGCDAPTFAKAFREVVSDPDSRFGLIQVKRPAARVGKDFELGERFQGCFSLERGLRSVVPAGIIDRLFASAAVRKAATWIEDTMLSDYGEVIELDTFRLRYHYLEGTPIAGSSVFEVIAIDATSCRVRQVFEFQEVNGIAVATIQSLGIKLHNQVVYEEIAKAAARAGARVLSSTIPAAYVEVA